MSSTELLMKIMNASVKKHGDHLPMTVGHLRNIVVMLRKLEIEQVMKDEALHIAIINEIGHEL